MKTEANKSEIPGVITTDFTYDQVKMITDIAASLDMTVEELTMLALQDIIDITLTPEDELTELQLAYAMHLNDKTTERPISFLQYLREMDVNPELLWLEMQAWIEDETELGDEDNIDILELITSRPDMPYIHLWKDFIAIRKELEMLPIVWQDEFTIVKKWIVDKKNLLGEISYV